MPATKGDEGASGARAQAVPGRVWLRVAVVYAFIPLLLLVCGGDPGWWQAWVYAVLILAAGIGGRVWAEQRHPGLTAERQDPEVLGQAKPWDKVLAPLMAVSITFPVVIVAGLDHRYDWTGPSPLWLSLLGLVLIALGYGLSAWALAENRFFHSVVRIRADQGHVVCDSGPYRFVRHPGYAGSLVSLAGTILALNSVWTLIPVGAALIVTLARTALEDQALHDELPGYRDYARRVRFRLLPGVF